MARRRGPSIRASASSVPPLVVDGVAFVLARSGTIKMYQTSRGTPILPAFDVGARVEAEPAVGQGVLYVRRRRRPPASPRPPLRARPRGRPSSAATPLRFRPSSARLARRSMPPRSMAASMRSGKAVGCGGPRRTASMNPRTASRSTKAASTWPAKTPPTPLDGRHGPHALALRPGQLPDRRAHPRRGRRPLHSHRGGPGPTGRTKRRTRPGPTTPKTSAHLRSTRTATCTLPPRTA